LSGSALTLPILRELIPGEIEYGTNFLVEFEPHSLWFETSVALAVYGLRNGIKTDYHTWMRPPSKIRESFSRLGLDVSRLEEMDILRIGDSYSTQTGLNSPDADAYSSSVKVADLSIAASQVIKSHEEADKQRLHIDDNNSVLTQYNDEKAVINYYRTRIIPECKTRELIAFHALAVDVHSQSFYKQFELFCDGIVDFRSQIRDDGIEQTIRVRMMRDRTYDSRPHKLQLLNNRQIVLLD